MSLEIAHMNAARPRAERIPEGTYPARLISVIDLGIQPQTDWQTGEATDPKPRILCTWELPTETQEMTGEDGEAVDMPRLISKEYTSSNFDQSNLMKLIKALAAGERISSVVQLLGVECMLNIGSTVTGNAKVTSVMRAPKGMPVAEAVNPITSFDFDAPDRKLFEAQVGWIQQKIRGAVNYTGWADTWGVEA